MPNADLHDRERNDFWSYIPNPTIVERTGRGERQYDIWSRLLEDRIVFLGTPINDTVANFLIGQFLYLQKSDRNMVEIASRLLAEVRDGVANAALYGQCIRTLALLGMSPTERSKVQLPKSKNDNPFAMLDGPHADDW